MKICPNLLTLFHAFTNQAHHVDATWLSLEAKYNAFAEHD